MGTLSTPPLKEVQGDAVLAGALTDRLAKGWKGSHVDVVGDFINRLANLLGGEPSGLKYSDDAARFDLDLGSSIHLAGMDDVKCLLVGGDVRGVGESVGQYWATAGSAGRLGLVVALSEEIYEEVRKLVPRGRALVLNPPGLTEIFSTSPPKIGLLKRLRHQIPLRRLNPFRIEGPVWNHMFQGRRHELDRLKEEENTNFAVAGPSRIGKSSLLRRYRDFELRKERDPRLRSSFYFDLYQHSHLNEDGLAQLIALRIESSLKNSRLGSDRLRYFLEYQKQHLGRPVELVFDEVDSLINLATFQLLGQAARDGLCRLILAGRGELAKMTLRQDSPFGCRMDWLTLEPLSEASSMALFLDGLSDLGFSCPSPDRVCEKLDRWTGRLPHLIQLYGKDAAERLIQAEAFAPRIVSERLMETIRDSAKTAAYVLSPLDDLAGRDRKIALEILRRCPERITVSTMLDIATSAGVSLTEQEVLRVCTELVICNILIWQGRGYRIANESLPQYAKDLGFLGGNGLTSH